MILSEGHPCGPDCFRLVPDIEQYAVSLRYLILHTPSDTYLFRKLYHPPREILVKHPLLTIYI